MQELLRSLLDYNPDTGQFIWKTRPSNNVYIGDNAGTLHSSGYIKIKIKGKSHRAHRLAYIYVYGDIFKGEVDHINGIKCDNRISNLRMVDRFGNSQNIRKPNINNKTGVLGVSHSHGKYRVQIYFNGKCIRETCDTLEAANTLYLELKRTFHTTCSI